MDGRVNRQGVKDHPALGYAGGEPETSTLISLNVVGTASGITGSVTSTSTTVVNNLQITTFA